MFNWNDRPVRAEVAHKVGRADGSNATVYRVGKYLVEFPGDDELEVTYSCPSETTDPGKVFPGLQVSDGELRLPVTDLVDIVLQRIDPVELAQALWTNEGVREAFRDGLAAPSYRGFSDGGLTDTDRRKFLASVQESVHNRALDELSSAMYKIEWEVCRHAHHFDEVRRINQTLRELDVKVVRDVRDDDGSVSHMSVLLQFDERDTASTQVGVWSRGEMEVAGKCWEEARDHWRTEVRKLFPGPGQETKEGGCENGGPGQVV